MGLRDLKQRAPAAVVPLVGEHAGLKRLQVQRQLKEAEVVLRAAHLGRPPDDLVE
jgi:hypothetical protein